ncbi:MAG: polymer-forming cytoskeletal protein [Candidatus Omnitrophota bacterium]
MRRKKEDEMPVVAEPKILDVNASMQGTLRFDDPVNLRINGKFEGTLDTKGILMIGEKADIKADITGEKVSIAGVVTGNIKVSKSLELVATARLVGDVETPRLAVTTGAFLNGHIKMTGTSNPGANDSMTLMQLAEYLEVDAKKIYEWADNGMLPCTKSSGEWIFDKDQIDMWIANGKVKV